MCDDKVARIKTYAEIAALGSGAIFLVLKLFMGHFNYGMDVALEIQRSPDTKEGQMDNLVVTLKLKRPDGGRIELTDVQIELSEAPALNDSASIPSFKNRYSLGNIIKARNEEGGKIKEGYQEDGTALPPSDGTQLASMSKVPHGQAVFIDATIVGARTGTWFKPQWRASAISLPKAITDKSPSEDNE